MCESEELAAKLQYTDSEVQRYIQALKSEIAKLQKRIVKLEARNVSANKKIAAYLKQLDTNPQPDSKVLVVTVGPEYEEKDEGK